MVESHFPSPDDETLIDGVFAKFSKDGGDPRPLITLLQIKSSNHIASLARLIKDVRSWLKSNRTGHIRPIHSKRSLKRIEDCEPRLVLSPVNVQSVIVNSPPVISSWDTAVTYTENGSGILIDSNATIVDVDTKNFDGGKLIISLTANPQTTDRLTIRNQGTAKGQIGVSEKDVTLSGTIIGTFTGGIGRNPFVVAFNSNATPHAAQAVIRNILFSNTSDDPSTLPRTVQCVLTRIDGQSSNRPTKTTNIRAINDPPTANSQSLSTAEDTALQITLTGNDIELNPLTFTVVTGPSHGTLSGTGPNLMYQPDQNYNGPDHFKFTTNDGALDSLPATVSINIMAVNDAPAGANDVLSSLAEDSAARTIAFATLLGNDIKIPTNENDQTLTIIGVSNPVGGTVAIIGTNVAFTPTADFNGLAGFTYTLQDNGATNGVADFKTSTADVSFAITEVNDGPSFTKGSNQTVAENDPAQTVSGWATWISKGPADEEDQTVNFIVTNDNNSLFAVQPAIDASGTLRYKLAESVNGSATVTVQLQDSGGTTIGGVDTSAPEIFTITATPTDDIDNASVAHIAELEASLIQTKHDRGDAQATLNQMLANPVTVTDISRQTTMVLADAQNGGTAENRNQSFATAHSSRIDTFNSNVQVGQQWWIYHDVFFVWRGFLDFNLPNIARGTQVESAVLTFQGERKLNVTNENISLHVVGVSVGADGKPNEFGSVSFGSISYDNFVEGGTNTIVLSPSAVQQIVDGHLRLGLKISQDLENRAPSTSGNNAYVFYINTNDPALAPALQVTSVGTNQIATPDYTAAVQTQRDKISGLDAIIADLNRSLETLAAMKSTDTLTQRVATINAKIISLQARLTQAMQNGDQAEIASITAQLNFEKEASLWALKGQLMLTGTDEQTVEENVVADFSAFGNVLQQDGGPEADVPNLGRLSLLSDFGSKVEAGVFQNLRTSSGEGNIGFSFVNGSDHIVSLSLNVQCSNGATITGMRDGAMVIRNLPLVTGEQTYTFPEKVDYLWVSLKPGSSVQFKGVTVSALVSTRTQIKWYNNSVRNSLYWWLSGLTIV